MSRDDVETMRRREFLRRAAAAVLGPSVAGLACGGEGSNGGGGSAPGGGDSGSAPTASVPELVRAPWRPYDDTIVVDGLASPIQFNIPQESLPLGRTALDAVARSGITAVNITVNGRPTDDLSAYEASMAQISAWSDEIEAHPDVFASGRSVEEIMQAKESGRLALIYGLQNGTPFQDDLDRLEELHQAGLRIVQPTYNVQNLLGSGCLAPEDRGLTQLGRAAVARMAELGILLDLSHCGPQTTVDGIEAAAGPASITHSGCKAVFDHPRSKDDETLRLLADRGGVVGIYLMPFLNPEGPPTTDDVLAHIEHALDVCGEDHVGIGSDQGILPLDVSGDFQEQFEAVSQRRAAAGIAAPREETVPYVPELNHPRRLETIAGVMADRGHSRRVIEKVVGGNFMRLFSDVWS